jgi:NDP-sugar pyrophosphorylase family protein
VLVEEAPSGFLGTLYCAREHLREDFCWMAGDMLFTDPVPLKELVELHLAEGSGHSCFYCRTDRFKLKVRLGPPLEAVTTREPGYSLSVPNFHVSSPRIFSYMAPDPNANYLRKMIEAGEPVLFREYTAPVFEIDTPEDVAEARRFYGG